MKKRITINEVEYEIIVDVNEAIDKEVLAEKITEYLSGFLNIGKYDAVHISLVLIHFI